jgi:S1-C subfamily serine protease
MELGWELGFMVDSLTPQLAEFFKVPQGYGLLVKSVKEESPAYRSGFRAGDILVEINGRRLRSPRDFHHALEGVRGGELDIMFVREGRVQTRHVVLH